MFVLEGLNLILDLKPEGLTDLLCCRPVHGLIFLFKWQPGEEPAGSIVQDSRLDQIFFAKQVCLCKHCGKDALIRVLPLLQYQTFIIPESFWSVESVLN